MASVVDELRANLVEIESLVTANDIKAMPERVRLAHQAMVKELKAIIAQMEATDAQGT